MYLPDRTLIHVLVGSAVLGGSMMSAAQPTGSAHAGVPSAAIIELRQYTLHPGQRDVMTDLFDREFVESQEDVGMTVISQYRDLDRPDHFVWLRGFPDMTSRAASLTAFYSGPIWLAHADAANRTMIDSDNVLLLEPASQQTMLRVGPRRQGSASNDHGLIVATIHYPRTATREFSAFFAGSVRPLIEASGAAIVGEYTISTKPNNFRLPVREGENAFVWFARFTSAGDYQQHRSSLTNTDGWRQVATQLDAQLARSTETLRLVPTSRSRLLN